MTSENYMQWLIGSILESLTLTRASRSEFISYLKISKLKAGFRVYEQPILRSREPNCTEKDAELGNARQNQLARVSKNFVLRRTAEILNDYLPPKR